MKKLLLIVLILLIVITFVACNNEIASGASETEVFETDTVYYNSNGATSGTVPESQTKIHGTDLILASNSGNLFRSGYHFAGWNTHDDGNGSDYAEESAYTMDMDLILYAKWAEIGTQLEYSADTISFKINFVPGGYTFPSGYDDFGTPQYVDNSYWIGTTEVTYELWYEVYTWATSGIAGIGAGLYTFDNTGIPGHDGTAGTETASQEPVSTISRRDAIIWCNALTEWCNMKKLGSFNCVYYTDFDYKTPIRTVTNLSVIDDSPGGEDNPYVMADSYGNTDVGDCSANGFRLLTDSEWAMAARWRDNDTNTVSGYSSPWFTKGDSASGATADITNLPATYLVAWSSENSGDTTHPVMEKAANTLSVYDMSGNIVEYTFDGADSSDRSYFYGGDYSRAALFLQIGREGSNVPNYEYKSLGFRMGRSL